MNYLMWGFRRFGTRYLIGWFIIGVRMVGGGCVIFMWGMGVTGVMGISEEG